jgi:acyl-CoA reductase-like NAD-dependent aldehyde dehydrogenase
VLKPVEILCTAAIIDSKTVPAQKIKMGDASSLNPSKLTKIYLNGEYVDSKSKETFSLKNPKDNSVVVEGIPISGPEDVELAVKYAEEAYNGPWSKFTALQRTECFHKLAALLEEQLIPILTLDSLTSGNPVSIIPTREKTYIKNCILYYSGWTDKQKGDYFPADDGTW